MLALWQDLRQDLHASLETLTATNAFSLLHGQHPALRRFPDLEAVFDFLHGCDTDMDEKDAILATLVRLTRFRESRTIATAVLWLALWPGLDAVCRRNRRCFAGNPPALVSAIGAAFAEQIRVLDVSRAWRVAATILRNVQRALWTELHQERAAAALLSVSDPCQLDDDGTDALECRDRTWVAGAVRVAHASEGAQADLRARLDCLSPLNREVVMRVHVLGDTQREAASALGLSHSAVRKRLQRSKEHLRAEWERHSQDEQREALSCA